LEYKLHDIGEKSASQSYGAAVDNAPECYLLWSHSNRFYRYRLTPASSFRNDNIGHLDSPDFMPNKISLAICDVKTAPTLRLSRPPHNGEQHNARRREWATP